MVFNVSAAAKEIAQLHCQFTDIYVNLLSDRLSNDKATIVPAPRAIPFIL